MEETLRHAIKMRDACKEHAQLKLDIYKHFDQSERSKEVVASALERYSYWLRKVNELELDKFRNNPKIRIKDQLGEIDMNRCPSHDEDYDKWINEQL